MMSGKFEKLVEKLGADEQMTVKLLEQEKPEQAQAFLKEAGFEFSLDEILELREEINNMALSDEELDGVAGGVGGNIDPLGVVSWRGKRSRGILPVRNVRIRIRVPRGW